MGRELPVKPYGPAGAAEFPRYAFRRDGIRSRIRKEDVGHAHPPIAGSCIRCLLEARVLRDHTAVSQGYYPPH